MSKCIQDAGLTPLGLFEHTKVYGLHAPQLRNRYFLLSSAGTSELMAYPEVVGFESYLATLPATETALRHFAGQGLEDVDVLTILRGGLNYPMEEACHRCGIRVRDIHFLSCERVIENHVITGLEIKYEKVRVSRDRTLLMGDIIATGDTLRLCLQQFVELFHRRGGSLRKIIFFTIGGTRAISLMEELSQRIRTVFPAFEGFDCFFYEGVFTVYEDLGVSGINVPNIDFGWKGGAVTPEFRRYVLDRPDTLLEKCIIYDGGARRYEIPVHFHEVLEYWEGIAERAELIDPQALVAEKLGFTLADDFDKWMHINHFQEMDPAPLREQYARERALLERAGSLDLKAVAGRRIQAIRTILTHYE